jgi:hypothetical protein
MDPDLGQMTHWDGTILSKRKGRLMVRRDNGQRYSLPAAFRKPPTVFKQREYRFLMTYRDEARMNVIAHHPTGEAKIWMQPSVELAWNHGLTPRKLAETLRIAREREADILAAWQKYHGEGQRP